MSKDKTIISILMPTYNQARFIRRALTSLHEQTFKDWELIIINDGSTDNTEEVIKPYLTNTKIKYFKHTENKGLGATLNEALQKAEGEYITYLPSDDIYFANHLQTLYETLSSQKEAIAAYSGVRHHYNKSSDGQIAGYSLQLVQVIHKKTNDTWIERTELVTDDLHQMFWEKLKKHGQFIPINQISCEWVDHPQQRHKIIQEPLGGINPYKLYYNVKHPLIFKSTVGNLIDEVSHYKSFRERPDTPQAKDRLKILLVGELAYNADRILALEESGHKLYGLWMKDPYWYNTVGPLPFGHVEDIPYENWKEKIKEIKPDIIYALLNWQAVPIAHEVLTHNPGIPFVWHFKEGPFICLEKGTWNELIDLYTKSDGQIYTSPEMRDWFQQYLNNNLEYSHILDGDLPKKEWFTNDRSPLISDKDGEIHTVVPGRPIGLHPQTVAKLAENKIHLHFYGDFTHGQWKEWIQKTLTLAPNYLHIHPNVDQRNWVKEFSQYDAGWLHFFESSNNGELMRANWDDLNYPARMATLAVCGLPMLQHDNSGHIVATQTLIKQHNLGLFFKNIPELAQQLYNKQKMTELRERVWQTRHLFSFDYHTDELVKYFRKIIAKRS